jgi:diguanylate cyclase (GGDEF)-like protein/PAS domain S-box-containing protein
MTQNGLPTNAGLGDHHSLAQVLMQAPVAMLLLRADGTVLAANQACAQLLGRDAATLHQLQLIELILPDHHVDTCQLLQELLAGRHPTLQRHTRWLHADGQPLDALLLASCLPGGDGQLLILQLIASGDAQLWRDRSRADTALSITENIPAGTYVIGISPMGSPRFTFVSDRWLNMLQIERDAVLADPSLAYSRFHPDDVDAFTRLQDEVIAARKPLAWEGRIVVNGETRWVSIESLPRDGLNGCTIWEGVMVDITRRQQALAELQQERSLLHTVLTHIDAHVYMKDRQGRYLYANPSTEKLLGTGQGSVQGRSDTDLLPPDVASAIRLVDQQVFRLGVPCRLEESLPDHAGGERVFLTEKLLHRQPGRGDCLIGFSTDITDLRRASQQLAASEEHFRLLAENSNDVVCRIADDGCFLWISPSLTTTLGWHPDEWIGRQAGELLLPSGADSPNPYSSSSNRTREQVLARDGSIHWVESLSNPYRNAQGQPVGRVLSFRLIDQQVAAEQQLQQLATTDPLTGVANRRQLESQIRQAVVRADRYAEPLSLILADVDHFKAINDGHGHQTGDQVLIAFCRRIRQQLRCSDVFGRWGGEEFLILLPQGSLSSAAALAEKLRQLIAASPFPQVGRVTASFGVAARIPHEPDHAWFQRVDSQLYAAKTAGRNRVHSG